jgi:hypothetical protein
LWPEGMRWRQIGAAGWRLEGVCDVSTTWAWFLNGVIIHDIPLCLCHPCFIRTKFTCPLSQNCRMEHWLLSQETIQYSEIWKTAFPLLFLQYGRSSSPDSSWWKANWDEVWFLYLSISFSYLVPRDQNNLFVLPFLFGSLRIICSSVHICKLAAFMFDFKGESNDPYMQCSIFRRLILHINLNCTVSVLFSRAWRICWMYCQKLTNRYSDYNSYRLPTKFTDLPMSWQIGSGVNVSWYYIFMCMRWWHGLWFFSILHGGWALPMQSGWEFLFVCSSASHARSSK